MRIFSSFHFHNSLLSSIRRSLDSFPFQIFLAITVSLSSLLPVSLSMALHLSFFPPSVRSPPSLPCSGKFLVTTVSDHSSLFFKSKSFNSARSCRSNRASKRLYAVKSSLDIVGPTVGKVTEVNKDTFWPIVNAAGEKAVVLDMYTQWCGPCKVMAPKFQELSEKYLDVVFLKLDCNQENKPLAKELGIRVVPTFKILKDNKVVKEVTGAKFDDLVVAIEAARSS